MILEKIITKKLDEQDAISLHANPTNIDVVSGSNRIKNSGDTDTPVQNNRNKGSHYGDTDTPVQNNREKGSHNTEADQGSAVRGTPQKNIDSSIGDLFRNRKRHGSIDEDEPQLKMSREILQ